MKLPNSKDLTERVFYTFVNDHEPAMNVLSDSEEKIKYFIESNFECEWDYIKDIENVTCFNAGNGSIDDFWGEPFTILL